MPHGSTSLVHPYLSLPTTEPRQGTPKRIPGPVLPRRSQSAAGGEVFGETKRSASRCGWAAGSMAEARKQATLRLEGKEYDVQDGEIVHIRFNI